MVVELTEQLRGGQWEQYYVCWMELSVWFGLILWPYCMSTCKQSIVSLTWNYSIHIRHKHTQPHHGTHSTQHTHNYTDGARMIVYSRVCHAICESWTKHEQSDKDIWLPSQNLTPSTISILKRRYQPLWLSKWMRNGERDDSTNAPPHTTIHPINLHEIDALKMWTKTPKTVHVHKSSVPSNHLFGKGYWQVRANETTKVFRINHKERSFTWIQQTAATRASQPASPPNQPPIASYVYETRLRNVGHWSKRFFLRLKMVENRLCCDAKRNV